jgi:hypothetical protein
VYKFSPMPVARAWGCQLHVALGALQRGYHNDACTRQSTQIIMDKLTHIKRDGTYNALP